MAQTIKLKRSATAGAIPSTSDLALGEIAINTADGAVYIKKGNDDIVAVHDNDILHIDTTNSRVGIGKTNPSKTLDVNGSMKAFAFEASGSGNKVITIGSSNDGTYYNGLIVWNQYNTSQPAHRLTASSSGGSHYEYGRGMLSFIENQGSDVTRMVIKQGNVGIGTTSPSANLHVSSTGDTILKITSADGNGAFLDLGDASDTDGGRIVYDSGSNLAFYTASTERARIDSSGNVGIGTTSPSSPLHVQTIHEEATLIESNSNNGTRLKVSNSDATTGRKAILDLAPANNITGAYIVAEAQEDFSTTANRTADLYFSTRHDNVFSEKLRITSDGNVGIGTDSPARNLHVHASNFTDLHLTNDTTGTTASDGTSFSAINSDIYLTNREAGNMVFQTSGTERVRIDASGHVGIATTSPGDARLKIVKPTATWTGSQYTIDANGYSSFGGLRINGADNARDIHKEDNASFGIGSNYDSDIFFYQSNSVKRLMIKAGGNVGIGTENPDTKLHVDGVVKIGDTLTLKEDGTNDEIKSTGNVLYVKADEYSFQDNSNNQRIAINSSGAIEFNNAYTFPTSDGTSNQVLVTDGSGNLSFSDVSGSSGISVTNNANNRVLTGDGTNANAEANLTFDGSTLTVTGEVSGVTAIRHANSNLQVIDNDNDTYFILNDPEGANRILIGDSGDRTTLFRNDTFKFQLADGTEKMRIDSSGNLLVGTTNASGSTAPDNSSDTNNAGLRLSGSLGFIGIGSNSQPTTYLNRIGSDGTIAEFRKDGSTVGRIGTYSGGLVIGNGDTGLRMQDSINAIYAFNVTTGANRDSAVDIGASSVKFKDLYLSGSISANDLTTENNVSLTSHGTVDLVTIGAGSRAGAIKINDVAGANYSIAAGGYDLTFYKNVSGTSNSQVMQFVGADASDSTPDVKITNNLIAGENITLEDATSGVVRSQENLVGVPLEDGLVYFAFNHNTSTHPSSESTFDTMERDEITSFKDIGTWDNSSTFSTSAGGSGTNYLAEFHGYLLISTAGNYRFGLDSDDASDMYIDGIRVADDYGAHGSTGFFNDSSPTSIYLTVGYHKLFARFEQVTGGHSIRLGWNGGSGTTLSAIPSANLYHNSSDLTKAYNGTTYTEGNLSLYGAITSSGAIDIDTTNPQLTFRPDDGILFRLRVDETANRLELGHSSNKNLYLSNTGNATFNYDLGVSGDLTVTGDLTVNGTTTTLNTQTLDVEDKNITLNYSTGDSSGSANGAGITIQDAVDASTDATILWDATNNEFDFSHGINVTGDSITVNNYLTAFTLPNNSQQYMDVARSFAVNVDSDNNSTSESFNVTYDNRSKKALTVQEGGDVSFYEDTGTTAKLFWDASAERFYGDTTTTSLRLSSSAGSQLSYGTGIISVGPSLTYSGAGSERFRITDQGLVGIGASSPDGDLEVVASTTVSGASDSVNNVLIGLQSTNRPTIILDTADTTYTNRTWNITNVGSAGTLRIGRNGLDVMSLKNDGKVGIGTDSPGQELDVAGNIRVQNNAAFMGTNVAGSSRSLVHLDSNNVLKIKGNDSEGSSNVISMIAGGDVGIGTTSPSQKLDVAGHININTPSGASQSGYALKLNKTNSSSQVQLGVELLASPWASNTNGGNLIIKTANSIGTATTAMTIDGAQNVGIGVTDPATRLEVKHDSNASTGITVENTSTGTGARAMVEFKSDAAQLNVYATGSNYSGVSSWGDAGVLSSSSSSSGGLILNAQSGGIKFQYGTTERMRVHTNGNVGVNESTPLAKMEVAGSIKATSRDTGHTSEAGVTLSYDTSNSIALLETWTSKPLLTRTYNYQAFDISGTEMMRINSTGVGIGTTSPNCALHVNGQQLRITNGGPILTLQDTTDDDDHTIRFQDSAGTTQFSITSLGDDFNFVTNGSRDIRFVPDNTEAVRITSAGNVGIGTTSPQYQLDIEGSSATARVKKTANDATMIVESTTAGAWTTYRSPNNYAGALYVINGTEQWAAGLLEGVDRWTVRKGRSGSEYFTITNPGKVGISQSAPAARFQVEEYGIDTTETSSTATTQIAIHTFAATDFRSARFTVQVTNSTDSTYHTTELLLLHDGTTANITEFGEIFTGSAVEATFDADISSGNVRLLATPASTDSMEFKVVAHTLTT